MQIKKTKINSGGDGGEIFIFAKKMAGKGLITVDGGNESIGGNAGKVHIETDDNKYKGKISTKGGKSSLKSKWWENSWIQLIILISAILGIAGFLIFKL